MTPESSGNPRLLVFLHVAAKQRAFQTELQTSLPGIVVAFLVSGSRDSVTMLLGAFAAQ